MVILDPPIDPIANIAIAEKRSNRDFGANGLRAQVSLQSGRYAGKVIARRVAGKPALPPFAYLDKGILATVARNYALLECGPFRLAGLIAKLAWAFVHIFYLIQNEDRMVVFVKWMYAYFTRRRGTRIIEESCACE